MVKNLRPYPRKKHIFKKLLLHLLAEYRSFWINNEYHSCIIVYKDLDCTIRACGITLITTGYSLLLHGCRLYLRLNSAKSNILPLSFIRCWMDHTSCSIQFLKKTSLLLKSIYCSKLVCYGERNYKITNKTIFQ